MLKSCDGKGVRARERLEKEGGDEIVRICRQALAAPERCRLMSLPVRERREAFFAYWTRRKAVLKATGEGCRYAFKGVEVSGPGEDARFVLSPTRLVGQVTRSTCIRVRDAGRRWRMDASRLRLGWLDGRSLLMSR